jgi:hypothetical protein
MIPRGWHSGELFSFSCSGQSGGGGGGGRQRKYNKEKAIRKFSALKKFPASVICGNYACLRAPPFLVYFLGV